jgi:hypothetical protein
MIDAGIFTLLSTTAAITSICQTRIYPVILPTGPTLPALTYQLIAAKTNPTFETSGMQRWRIQFDCWAETYADAAGLRKALIQTLNGYQGTLSDGTVLQNADLQQIVDFFEDNARVFRCMVELYMYFNFSS